MLVEIEYERGKTLVGEWGDLPERGVEAVSLVTAEGKARFGGYDVYFFNPATAIFGAYYDEAFGNHRASSVRLLPGMTPEHLGELADPEKEARGSTKKYRGT